ncbi:hypothetical protein [Ornithinimicrobium cerasi]|uniref:hypothetical protein n=1 Tax=Ornithinimicrobium cerasi TaxID=2248773 RepID=UPI000EFF5170|nr:hypothetical protein [Ornithinimicrobium cerasi]
MTYRYGRDWHGKLRKPMQEITEAQARKRFTDGPHLSVSRVDAAGEVPDYTLVLQPGAAYVRSSRYDGHGREVSVYHFREQDDHPGELFLEEVTVRVYPDGEERWLDVAGSKAHTTVTFRPNGWARARFAVPGLDQARVEEFTGVDVSGHWVQRPEFGDWDGLGEAREPALPTGG